MTKDAQMPDNSTFADRARIPRTKPLRRHLRAGTDPDSVGEVVHVNDDGAWLSTPSKITVTTREDSE